MSGLYPEYPLFADKETVNGKEFTIIGVQHTPEFFNSYKSFFKKRVAESDAVILEQSVGSEFWKSSFFGKAGEAARAEQKRVYQIDPVTLANFSIDTIGIPVACVFGIVHELRDSKTGRRDFLKKIGKIGLYSYLLSGTLELSSVKASIDEEIVSKYGMEDVLSYGWMDYRNVSIADGIDRLSRETDGIRKIASIHGNNHADTVIGYIKDAELREIKKNLYLPYDNRILSKTKIREYIPGESGWKLVREF